MDLKDHAIGVAQKAMQGGAVRSFFGFWNGKCTFFAIVFSVIGVYGWLVLNRDLTSFALFAGAVQALLTVHSIKEDHFQAQAQVQQQNVNVVVDNAAAPSPIKAVI